VDICTVVQRSCLDYIEAVNEGHLQKHNDLYYEYVFELSSRKVLFRCYNTAWVSTRHEEPAHLFFPLTSIEGQGEGFDLVVSVFHHPYNWLSPENARGFRKHVETSSDIILTGHEHVYTRHMRVAIGETNEYIEGGVLQEHDDPSISSFNALVLDLDTQMQKFFHFAWDGEIYALSPGVEDEWEDFQANQLLARREFELSDTFEAYLEDQEAKLTHSTRGTLRLSDVFVWPDLREVSEKVEGFRIIKGDEVFERVLEQCNLVIAGPEKSGRTALAKALFKEFRVKGFVPILIDGASFRAQYDDGLYKSIYRLFEQQYSSERLEKYKQLEGSRKVVIFDDFDKVEINKRGKQKIYSLLKRFSDCVVLLVNDLT
jgi:hypothetical protein